MKCLRCGGDNDNNINNHFIANTLLSVLVKYFDKSVTICCSYEIMKFCGLLIILRTSQACPTFYVEFSQL